MSFAEVANPHLFRLIFGPPFPALILEVSGQPLLLLSIEMTGCTRR